jgi:hypothetical protein
MARLHRCGEGLPRAALLAREMVLELLRQYPDRQFVLLGDGAYSNSVVLEDLPGLGERIDYTGRMRADAAIFDPKVPVMSDDYTARPTTTRNTDPR